MRTLEFHISGSKHYEEKGAWKAWRPSQVPKGWPLKFPKVLRMWNLARRSPLAVWWMQASLGPLAQSVGELFRKNVPWPLTAGVFVDIWHHPRGPICMMPRVGPGNILGQWPIRPYWKSGTKGTISGCVCLQMERVDGQAERGQTDQHRRQSRSWPGVNPEKQVSGSQVILPEGAEIGRGNSRNWRKLLDLWWKPW